MPEKKAVRSALKRRLADRDSGLVMLKTKKITSEFKKIKDNNKGNEKKKIDSLQCTTL